MPTYQLLRCMVALGGDMDNIVARHRGRPIAYPELAVLRHIHGDDAVFDVAVVGSCDMPLDEMLARLRTTYDPEYVKAVYPGTRPKLQPADHDLPLCTRPIYKAPPTRPANLDPILRPLIALNPTDVEVITQVPVPEDVPTDAEIARNAQRDHPDDFDDAGELIPELETPVDDQVDLAAAMRPAVPATGPGTTAPRVQDQPQSRTGFRGQARQARPTPAHLPDVSGVRERLPEKADHDRPRG